MFKRILAICLCVVAFIFSIIPASAEDYSPSWINCLAYGGGNGVGQTRFNLPAKSTITVNLPLPQNTSARYFEMAFRSGVASKNLKVSVVYAGKTSALTFSDTSTDLVTFGWASLSPGSFSSISIRVQNLSGSSSVFEIISAELSVLANPFTRNIDADIGGRTWAGTLFSAEYRGSQTTLSFGHISGTLDQRGFDLTIYIDEAVWTSVDFIKVNMLVGAASILAPMAKLGQYPVDLTTSPWQNSITQEGTYTVTLTVDVSHIQKTAVAGNNLQIMFSGVSNVNSGTFVIFNSISGYVENSDSNQNFFSYWFGVIRDGIGEFYSGLGNWFSQLFGKLADGFQSVVDAIVGDSEENQEMEDEAADQEQALGDLNSSLNDYEKPDPGSMNIDIQVDPVGLGFISGGLGGIYQSSIFGQILTMIGILGLAGYVFFGKR